MAIGKTHAGGGELIQMWGGDFAVRVVAGQVAVAEIVGSREVHNRESLGRMVRTTVLGALSESEQRRVTELDIDVVPVSLQQLVVHLTNRDSSSQKQEVPA